MLRKAGTFLIFSFFSHFNIYKIRLADIKCDTDILSQVMKDCRVGSASSEGGDWTACWAVRPEELAHVAQADKQKTKEKVSANNVKLFPDIYIYLETGEIVPSHL